MNSRQNSILERKLEMKLDCGLQSILLVMNLSLGEFIVSLQQQRTILALIPFVEEIWFELMGDETPNTQQNTQKQRKRKKKRKDKPI